MLFPGKVKLAEISEKNKTETTSLIINTQLYYFSDSTNTDIFSLPMGILVESIYGNGQMTTILPGGITAAAPTQPLPMSMLDSLTVHAKMRWG